MTTIAWDGRYVAADSRCTYSSYKGPLPVRKIAERDGVVYGITGYGAWFEAWIKWHQDGANPKEIPASGLDVNNAGNFLIFKGHQGWICHPGLPYLQEVGAPDAWGTGGDFAIGAMKQGADARRAIEVAIECNSETGGEIRVIDVQALVLQEIAA